MSVEDIKSIESLFINGKNEKFIGIRKKEIKERSKQIIHDWWKDLSVLFDRKSKKIEGRIIFSIC